MSKTLRVPDYLSHILQAIERIAGCRQARDYRVGPEGWTPADCILSLAGNRR